MELILIRIISKKSLAMFLSDVIRLSLFLSGNVADKKLVLRRNVSCAIFLLFGCECFIVTIFRLQFLYRNVLKPLAHFVKIS